MICFYHADLDGQCSAAIVRRWWKLHGIATEHEWYVESNYNAPLDPALVERDEKWFMVDFSVGAPKMRELVEQSRNGVWIDHHRTAIGEEGSTGFPQGIRGKRDTGEAGCVLTWQWCFPSRPLPRAVKLIGDRDIWHWAFGDETKFFCAGMLAEDCGPESQLWYDLLGCDGADSSDGGPECGRIVDQGTCVERYKQCHAEAYMRRWSFPSILQGHEILAVNAAMVDSNFFGPDPQAEILAPFAWDGEQWTVSLYSKTVDVGRIAESYGGGGHPGAAGFQCKELPFV